MAWRADGRVHFASDSRIKFGEAKYADVGIKVLSIPVSITDANGVFEDGVLVPAYKLKTVYGFAYAGSFVNAGTFAELIAELLQHVQHVREDDPLSFDTVCRFLLEFCTPLCTEVCKFMDKHGRYVFFLGGWCPLEKRLRVAKVEFTHADGVAKALYAEVLTKDGEVLAVGSGEACAMKRLKDGMPPLLALNDVIDSGEDPAVGGDLQYGSFEKSGDFAITGIIRVSTETVTHNGATYGPEEFRMFKYRGFTMYADWDPMRQPLWVTASFVELPVPSNDTSRRAYREFKGLPPE